MRHRRLWLAAVAFAVAGCDRNEPPVVAAPQAPADRPIVRPGLESVDTCAMLPRPDAEALLGPLAMEPEAMPPQGSLLGGCQFMSEGGTIVMVSARPAMELDATLAYARKRKGEPQTLAGFGAKAFQTGDGLMFQPAGRHFFLVINAMSGGARQDAGMEANVAGKLKY